MASNVEIVECMIFNGMQCCGSQLLLECYVNSMHLDRYGN